MKTKEFWYITILVLFGFCINAQTTYICLNSEALTKLKNDAVINGDYAKAADIKKELDARDAEQKTIDSLKVELDPAVKRGDYSDAATIQTNLKQLTELFDKKNILRKNIANALTKEDYQQANQYKTELENLYYTAKQQQEITKQVSAPDPVIESTNTTSSYITTNNNYNLNNTHPEKKARKTLLGISFNNNASVGLVFATIPQKGVGFFFDFRISPGAPTINSASSPVIKDGQITSTSYTWRYNGVNTYKRQEFNVGLAFRLFGNMKKISGSLLTGIGYTFDNYIYQYEQYDQSGNFLSLVNLQDQDLGGDHVNIENMFLVNFKFINIHIGGQVIIPHPNHSSFVFGVGLAL